MKRIPIRKKVLNKALYSLLAIPYWLLVYSILRWAAPHYGLHCWPPGFLSLQGGLSLIQTSCRGTIARPI